MRIIFLFIPFLLAFSPFESPKGTVEEGNRFFSEQKYDEALNKYDRAAEQMEDKSPIKYNRANTLLKKGDGEAALKEFRESAAFGDDDLKAKSFYNMGNVLYEGKNFGEAASAYKEALKHDPSDSDAKINLEMALKKIEEEKQKKEQEDQNKKEDDKEDQNKKDQQEEKDQDKEQESDDKSDKEGEKSGKDEKEKSHKNESSDEKKDMTREEAERLLEHLGDQNMDLQNMTDMVKSSNPSKVEKDW